MNRQDKNQQGFGIIEVIIIVAVTALIGTLGVVAYNSFQKKDKADETAKTTPKSNTIAALNPLTTLVSSSTKNTGPIIKLRKKPSGMADRIS